MEDYNLKDSGKRQEFSTGAVRDTNELKGDYSLLPGRAIARLALLYQKGAAKYSRANWRKGIPLSRYSDSALRHLFKFLNGDTSEDNICAAFWNIGSLIETQEMIKEGLLPKELDDLFEIQTGYTKEEYEAKFKKKD